MLLTRLYDKRLEGLGTYKKPATKIPGWKIHAWTYKGTRKRKENSEYLNQKINKKWAIPVDKP